MTRNWQDAHQKGQGFSPQAITQLTGIEVDLATLLAGSGSAGSAVFSRSGVVIVTTGSGRYLFNNAATVTAVRASVGTAPTGSTVIVDVNKNGTTIFTTQANRPSIAISGNASSKATPDVTSFAAGDYLTVDVDQAGSTVPGSDLTVQVYYTGG